MKKERKLVSFDWALKKILRSKANFVILEGFLSELLKEDIIILEVLESEGNKETYQDKFNRVDLKVKNSKGEILIVEVQHDSEFDYLSRILYGTSKAIVEHIGESDVYSQVVKVISVSILYFDLGHGEDYIYVGQNVFRGLHSNDELRLSQKQRKLYSNKENICDIYPTYYLIKINQFNDIAKDTIDEWIYFLKNEEIKPDFKAKGLEEAKKTLDVLKMSEEERVAYNRYMEDLRYEKSMLLSHYVDGREEGIQEGMQQGIQEGMQQGMQQGIQQGIQEGMLEGEAKILLRQLRKKFKFIPPHIEDLIKQSDLALLDKWADEILSAESIEELFGEFCVPDKMS